MTKAFILVLIAECCITIGQICFKKSADQVEKIDNKPWIAALIKGVLNLPTIWIGAAAMLVGMLFWFAALSSGELNYVYLLGSIQYIFALIAAHYFLGEKINKFKIIGTLLIMAGIILTALH